MRMRKFGSKQKAARFAKAMHMKAIRVRASKLADGSKGCLYKFKKLGKKRAAKRKTRKRRR
jgi:hypothetical protein